MSNIFIEGPISAENAQKFLLEAQKRTNTGALNMFLGQIRADKIDSKRVEAIDYSCYKSMAQKSFEKIIAESKTQFNLVSVDIYHSLGLVPVGGISLAVFVTAGHRKESFKGLEWIVEAIKKDVPIFGKEVIESGTYQWKVNK